MDIICKDCGSVERTEGNDVPWHKAELGEGNYICPACGGREFRIEEVVI